MRLPILFALALAMAPMCIVSASAQSSTRAIREAREAGEWLAAQAREDSAWLAASPLCNLPELVDTTGWVRPAPRSTVLLPKRFQRDTTFRSAHGGARWIGAFDTVEIATGHWGVRSFNDASQRRRCKATVGGMPVLILEDSSHQRLVGWAYRESASGYSPLFIGSGPNRATLLTILHHVLVARGRPRPCRPSFDYVKVDLFSGLLPSNVHWSGRVRMMDCAATPRIVIPARAAQLGR